MEQRRTRPEDSDHGRDDMTVVTATSGRVLLWSVVAVAAIVVLTVVLVIGPLGLITVVPAGLVVWVAAGVTSGGPTPGA